MSYTRDEMLAMGLVDPDECEYKDMANLVKELQEKLEDYAIKIHELGGDPKYTPVSEKVCESSTDKWKVRWWRMMEFWRDRVVDLHRAVKFYNEHQSPPGGMDGLEMKLKELVDAS